MGRSFLKQTAEILRTKQRRKHLKRAMVSLSVIVAMLTSYLLILPAVTMERDPICGQEEHTHTDECYEHRLICGKTEQDGQAETTQRVLSCAFATHVHGESCYNADSQLVCGYADYAIHTHDVNCYDADGNLVCQLPEVKRHGHDGSCYATETVLACGQEESSVQTIEESSDPFGDGTDVFGSGDNNVYVGDSEGGHTHTEECYETKYTLTCGKDEIIPHTHTDECYDENGNLVCGRLEIREHQHDENCFMTVTTDAVEGHTHTDECYEDVLICDKAEHVHTEECYPQEEAEDEVAEGDAEAADENADEAVVEETGDEVAGEEAAAEEDAQEDVDTVEDAEAAEEDADTAEETEAAEEEEDSDLVAMEPAVEYICGKEEHTHGEECWDEEGNLICGLEEHVHDETCLPEADDEEVAEEPEVAYVLTAEGSDYTVEVTYTDEAQIPDDAVLSVREIEPGTEEYESYYQQAVEAVQGGDTTTLSFARFFDISFVVDGTEIEPAAAVAVKISYKDAVEVPEGNEVKSVHFGEETEVLDVQTNGADGTVEEVEFDASSFSVYGIVGTGQITVPFKASDGRTYEVTVDFDERADIPEGAQLEVNEVLEGTAAYDSYVEMATNLLRLDSVNYVKLLDISILKDGQEIQPKVPVSVTVKLLDKDNTDSTPDVIHFGENETEIIKPEGIGEVLSFDAKGFSVYAIVEGDTSEDARLKVNFWNGTESFATMYVRKYDLQIESDDFSTIVYDPGVPEVGTYEIFKGWKIAGINNTNGTYDDSTTVYTIEGIRIHIREQANFVEGDELNIYAMIFNQANITYLDEKGTSLGTVQVMVPKTETKASYTVNMAYTPASSEQQFQGWHVTKGVDHIQGHTEGTTYANSTGITIVFNETTGGDITFSANAPTGNWLIFDENGSGATYVTPQFVKDRDTTTEPTMTMVRNGYTFGGWYTDAACTDANKFEFNKTLASNTTIYAKWTPAQQATYTVLIWRQRASDAKDAADAAKTYDFAESISLTGNVGSVINTVSTTGTGNDRYALVNNVQKRYEGFHLNKYDENVTIVTEGSSVLNVYYDRNLITLTFYIRSNGSSTWSQLQQMTGLYGSTLASNKYTWPTDYWWYANGSEDGTASGNRTTFLDAFIVPSGGSIMNFYGSTSSGSRHVYFYKQNADNDSQYDWANDASTSSNKFDISDKYNGFRAVSYSTDNSKWTPLGDKDGDGYYARVENYTNLYIRYDRLKYNLLYMDGVYVDGDNNVLTSYTSRGQLKTVEDITYGSSMTSYNNGGSGYYAPTYDGFVFEGWYTDDQCTQPYKFTTMPEGLTVYAKWRQIQYRVFLHPNAGTDSSLDWGSDSQAMNFRISYGGKVSTPIGLRKDYEFVGWYMDSNFTQVFNADAFILNDTTVTAAYDKTDPANYTDVMDKWGNSATCNADFTGNSGNERFWITRKLDLYARWRAKLIGADGITVEYDAGEGSGSPTDTTKYVDSATATAQEASQPPTVAEGVTPLSFKYWVVQTWNGTAYEDTETTVFPGDQFTVLKANAKITDEDGKVISSSTLDPDKKYTYTVRLRAVYELWDSATKTTIKWHSNDVDKDGNAIEGAPASSTGADVVHTDADIKVNEAVGVQGKPTNTVYEGYKFLGWARRPNTSTLWLEYQSDGTYKLSGTDTTVSKVAADQLGSLPNDVYAIWEPNKYTVTVKKVVDGETDTTKEFTFTTQNLSESNFVLTSGGSKVFEDEVKYGTKIKVTETGHDNYVVESVTAYQTTTPNGTALDEGNYIDLFGEDGKEYTVKGDVVITYTNKRNTVDVTVKKELVDAVVEQAEFSFTAALTDGNAVIDLGNDASFKVTSGTDGYTIEDVPSGSTLVLTEVADPDYKYTITAAGSSTMDADAQDSSYMFTVPMTAETVTFTNTLPKTSIILKKVNKDTNAPLNGAEFTLLRKNANGTYVSVEGLYSDGISITTGGQITLEGLPTGEYKLTESKAPDGYIIASNEIEFYLNAKATGTEIIKKNKDDTSTGTITLADNATTDGSSITVTNTPGQALPNTGGPGTLLYTLSGLMLVIASALMYGFRMRRRERRSN